MSSKATKAIVTQLVTKIQNQIQVNSNALTKASVEKYMRNVEKSRGMKISEVKTTIFKEMWATDLKGLDIEDKKEIAHVLLGQGFGEDKYFGTLIFDKIKTSIELDDIKRVEDLFKDGTIVGWANTDTICGNVFKSWATGKEENVKYICDWKNSDCLWLQRASCVAFVVPAKYGDTEPNFNGFTDMLLDTCATTVKNQERFVQLGTGWLLRNIGMQNEPRLLDFIEKNYDHFIREGLSYAVEKLDTETRKKMIGLKGKKDLDNLEKVEKKTRKRQIKEKELID